MALMKRCDREPKAYTKGEEAKGQTEEDSDEDTERNAGVM